jgi:hypothetical protein
MMAADTVTVQPQRLMPAAPLGRGVKGPEVVAADAAIALGWHNVVETFIEGGASGPA